MSKEKGRVEVTSLSERRNKAEEELAQAVREYVVDNLPEWNLIASELLSMWNTQDSRYLLDQRHLLPITSGKGDGYIFIDLHSGEVLQPTRDHHRVSLKSAVNSSLVKYGDAPERVDPDAIGQELRIIEQLRGQWGRMINYRRDCQNDPLMRGVSAVEPGEELMHWFLMQRLVAFKYLIPDDFTSQIADAVTALGFNSFSKKTNYVDMPVFENDVLVTMWMMIDDLTLDLTTDRRLMIRSRS